MFKFSNVNPSSAIIKISSSNSSKTMFIWFFLPRKFGMYWNTILNSGDFTFWFSFYLTTVCCIYIESNILFK